MIFIWYAGLILALSAVAFVSSIMGIGGGVFYTPIQIFFGVNIYEAATTSLFLIIILSAGATSIYRKARKVDWLIAIVFEIFTASGGFAGGFLSNFISAQALTMTLTAVILLAGTSMLLGNAKESVHYGDGSVWYLWKRKHHGETFTVNMLLAVPLCLVAGALSGMVGVGGGVIKVPMMVVLLGVPVDIAIATSGFMVGITALGGFSGHLVSGHWNWRLCLLLTPGVFLGAQLGARCMLKLNKARLKKAFGIFMLLVAASLLLRILRIW